MKKILPHVVSIAFYAGLIAEISQRTIPAVHNLTIGYFWLINLFFLFATLALGIGAAALFVLVRKGHLDEEPEDIAQTEALKKQLKDLHKPLSILRAVLVVVLGLAAGFFVATFIYTGLFFFCYISAAVAQSCLDKINPDKAAKSRAISETIQWD